MKKIPRNVRLTMVKKTMHSSALGDVRTAQPPLAAGGKPVRSLFPATCGLPYGRPAWSPWYRLGWPVPRPGTCALLRDGTPSRHPTEHHTFGREVAPNSISRGCYGTDTHEHQRIAKDGGAAREGKTATGRRAGPYPIGYGAIALKAAE